MMKKLNTVILSLGLALASQQVLAHGNHADVEPIDHVEASSKAHQVLTKLVDGKKLAANWKDLKAKDITPKTNSYGETLWVVSYVNTAEKDATKQNLFIVLDEVGNVVSAEHTNKL